MIAMDMRFTTVKSANGRHTMTITLREEFLSDFVNAINHVPNFTTKPHYVVSLIYLFAK